MSTTVNRIDLPELEALNLPAADALGDRLELVGHVTVRLAVSLGSAQLSIEELFALGSGDVIALDREVDAPVDVRIHDKVVARGTLVAAGDRFGVRITEISSV
jgi:flagellar motor switch protein FliN/FliY